MREGEKQMWEKRERERASGRGGEGEKEGVREEGRKRKQGRKKKKTREEGAIEKTNTQNFSHLQGAVYGSVLLPAVCLTQG